MPTIYLTQIYQCTTFFNLVVPKNIKFVYHKKEFLPKMPKTYLFLLVRLFKNCRELERLPRAVYIYMSAYNVKTLNTLQASTLCITYNSQLWIAGRLLSVLLCLW